MDLSRACAPIPPYPEPDWSRVPPPADCGEALVDPTALSPRITYAASYLCQGLDGALDRCLLRETLAHRLVEAIDRLPAEYSLSIFDGLRPLRVQKAIYDQFKAVLEAQHPDATPEELAVLLDDFVALPVKRPHRPAPHTTGGAVDLTLCRNGVPLDMGTGFDGFTALAYTRALEESCPPELEQARDDRRLLYHLMTSVGLVNYPCEWWHFAYGERQWAAFTGKAPIYGYCPICDL